MPSGPDGRDAEPPHGRRTLGAALVGALRARRSRRAASRRALRARRSPRAASVRALRARRSPRAASRRVLRARRSPCAASRRALRARRSPRAASRRALRARRCPRAASRRALRAQQGPSWATETPCEFATQRVGCVCPSQPHTGANSRVHIWGRGRHTPGTSVAPHCADAAQSQNSSAPQGAMPRLPQARSPPAAPPPPAAVHSPCDATLTPARFASHSLPYVRPSQPHTGW
ncbi:hypothetical protein DB32_005579 [Sandaracinus amylolyticus]|uniref:Uncharacterized protein n=1 Tax=Sandaracinus amylolyticus TaxID=927083 RepID=A0A0F6W667_9BACT|nr:hypothetical protein DB32_005579 [Sandaracinus amylolyticus]